MRPRAALTVFRREAGFPLREPGFSRMWADHRHFRTARFPAPSTARAIGAAPAGHSNPSFHSPPGGAQPAVAAVDRAGAVAAHRRRPGTSRTAPPYPYAGRSFGADVRTRRPNPARRPFRRDSLNGFPIPWERMGTINIFPSADSIPHQENGLLYPDVSRGVDNWIAIGATCDPYHRIRYCVEGRHARDVKSADTPQEDSSTADPWPVETLTWSDASHSAAPSPCCPRVLPIDPPDIHRTSPGLSTSRFGDRHRDA